MNIAICDDNLETLKSVAKLTEAAIISNGFDGEVTLATADQSLVYEKIKNHEIDVLFLDIDFRNVGKNGIEFGKELRTVNKEFKLIFMTSHHEYIHFTFDCKTFGYIDKPIDSDRIAAVLKRLTTDCSNCELGLFKVNKDYMIRTKDILFIERNKSKATIYTKDSTYESCSSLNTIEHELPNCFVRVHRSYIVNKEHICKISREDKSIYLDDNLICPLGQFSTKL